MLIDSTQATERVAEDTKATERIAEDTRVENPRAMAKVADGSSNVICVEDKQADDIQEVDEKTSFTSQHSRRNSSQAKSM